MQNEKPRGFVHKLFLFFLIALLPLFVFKEFKLILAKKNGSIPQESDFYEKNILVNQDKEFVIILLGKNHIDCIEKNLKSILSQSYSNYRVIYIDKGSTDGSFQKAAQVISLMKERDHVVLVRKSSDAEAYEYYYREIFACDDEAVVVHLEPTDWFAHEEVLDHLNKVYANQDVWLTYGQYLEYPSFKKGIAKPLLKKSLYQKKIHRAPWVIAHCKTFYAGLFKKVQMQDVDPGYFYSLEDETMLLLPVVEHGKSHVRFIPEVLYIHVKNPEGQALIANYGEEFARLLTPLEQKEMVAGVDLVMFSQNCPYQLNVSLESVKRHAKEIKKTTVIYQTDEKHDTEYGELIKKYTAVEFVKCEKYAAQEGFKSTVLDQVFVKNGAKYVVFATDSVILSDDIDFKKCISALEITEAYGFYFHLGRKQGKIENTSTRLPPDYINEGVCSFELDAGQGSFKYPNSMKMSLYRKEDLRADFSEMRFHDVRSLIDAWSKIKPQKRIGLFFDQPKIFSIQVP